MTEAHDWRQERDEYALGALLDEQDRLDYERQRNEDLGLDDERPTHDEMVEHFARERREVENRYELERIAEKALIAQWWRDRWGFVPAYVEHDDERRDEADE